MTDLIIKVLQGLATVDELRELHEWRARSPECERLYQAIARVWRITAAGDAGVRGGREPDPWDVVRRATSRPTGVVPLPRTRADQPQGKRWRRAGWVAAAAVVAALGIGRLYLGLDHDAVFGAEVKTGAGETTTVQLADGSFVRLGPRSLLRFDPAGDARQVWLDGRAFFAVSHAGRPFTVRTTAGDAVVLGTRFDLNVQEDDLTLLVVDGRVAVSAVGERVEVGGGEMTVSSADAGLEVRTVDDVFEHLEWMGQALLFQATPLRDVVRQIERVYAAEIVIEDASLGDRTFTASFANESFEVVIGVVCEVLSLACTVDQNHARIDSNAEAPARPVPAAPQQRR